MNLREAIEWNVQKTRVDKRESFESEVLPNIIQLIQNCSTIEIIKDLGYPESLNYKMIYVCKFNKDNSYGYTQENTRTGYKSSNEWNKENIHYSIQYIKGLLRNEKNKITVL